MVSEKTIFIFFSHYKSKGTNDSRGMVNFDPRGMVGKIYVEDHQHCYIYILNL